MIPSFPNIYKYKEPILNLNLKKNDFKISFLGCPPNTKNYISCNNFLTM